ncbi:hypothetical protein [Rhodanobacter sp. T12-5]|uniref:hypothetical protein n=1 Tax=Rhodanobacter sp. T12-5 TaxID=2024611 RepID=UPI001F5B7943|nr:hypothetical protein [Rhodanobacter sp. T12-5]
MVFIELAMLLLIPVTTTRLKSVTGFADFLLPFRAVSSAFAAPASCDVADTAAGSCCGWLAASCAKAGPKPAMAINATAQAAANGRR